LRGWNLYNPRGVPGGSAFGWNSSRAIGVSGRVFAKRFPDGVAVTGGRDFLKAALTQQDKKFDALCIVCHGYYNEYDPGRSGMLLGPPKGFVSRWIMLPGIGPARFRDLPFDYFPPRVTTVVDVPGDIVTTQELGVDVRTDAELVALVGCSTAVGSLVGADRYFSLAAQWLNIGAVSVLASSWAVDVRYAEAWLPRFLDR
jgi:CHAT domain-containing protein